MPLRPMPRQPALYIAYANKYDAKPVSILFVAPACPLVQYDNDSEHASLHCGHIDGKEQILK